MDLRVEKITAKHKDKRKVKEIYEYSFPKENRMPFWLLLLMSKTKKINFLSFYYEGVLCGFVYVITLENQTFIAYLAVDKSNRSKGYGSRILNVIQTMYENNKIFLFIERCHKNAKDIEQRIRRKKFYANNGYIETGFLTKITKEKREILIKNGDFIEEEFMRFIKIYSIGILKLKLWKMQEEEAY